MICSTYLLYFRLFSVPLDGGNSTVLDIWGYSVFPIYHIAYIAVLHEECEKSGMNSIEMPYSARKTSVCTSSVYITCYTIMLC